MHNTSTLRLFKAYAPKVGAILAGATAADVVAWIAAVECVFAPFAESAFDVAVPSGYFAIHLLFVERLSGAPDPAFAVVSGDPAPASHPAWPAAVGISDPFSDFPCWAE